MYSPTRKKGNKAEDIAVDFLKNKGYVIVERNYLRKCGEIDIIAEKDGILEFVEVKSIVSRETPVSRETDKYFYPLWNIHHGKLKKMKSAVQLYIAENYGGNFPDTNISAIGVSFNVSHGTVNIEKIDNIIFD